MAPLILQGIRLPDVSHLRPNSSNEEWLRALQGLAQQVSQWTMNATPLLSRYQAMDSALFTDGAASDGLRAGQMAYLSGGVWRAATAADSAKWAHGCCLWTDGKRCTIQHGLRVKVLLAGPVVTSGGTLWLSTSPGMVTFSQPTPGVTAVFQECGTYLAQAETGYIWMSQILRVEPER